MNKMCPASKAQTQHRFSDFMDDVAAVFGDNYLLRPRADCLRRIHRINLINNFFSCAGSWTFNAGNGKTVQWSRFHSPNPKIKILNIVLEAVADVKLSMNNCHLGKLCNFRNINILDVSPILSKVFDGRLLPSFVQHVNSPNTISTIFS